MLTIPVGSTLELDGFELIGGTGTATQITVIDSQTGASSTVTVNSGAGILNRGTLVLRNSRLLNNDSGTQGSILFNDTGGSATVIGSEISGNKGNGIHNQGTLSLTDTVISGNTGLGLYNQASATLTRATASDNNRDGILTAYPGTLEVVDGVLSGNDRFGIYGSCGTISLTNTTIEGSAWSGVANQRYTSGACSGSLVVDGGTIRGNGTGATAFSDGIYAELPVSVTRATISQHQTTNGAAIKVSGPVSVTISESTFSGNFKGIEVQNAGGSTATVATISILSSTITDNRYYGVESYGNGSSSSIVVVRGSTFSSNGTALLLYRNGVELEDVAIDNAATSSWGLTTMHGLSVTGSTVLMTRGSVDGISGDAIVLTAPWSGNVQVSPSITLDRTIVSNTTRAGMRTMFGGRPTATLLDTQFRRTYIDVTCVDLVATNAVFRQAQVNVSNAGCEATQAASVFRGVSFLGESVSGSIGMFAMGPVIFQGSASNYRSEAIMIASTGSLTIESGSSFTGNTTAIRNSAATSAVTGANPSMFSGNTTNCVNVTGC